MNNERIDVLAVIGGAAAVLDTPTPCETAKLLREARAAVAELIVERDALASWQREVTLLLAAAKSWMPTRKCAMHIREIDAALARVTDER